jgi:hypothetical protein
MRRHLPMPCMGFCRRVVWTRSLRISLNPSMALWRTASCGRLGSVAALSSTGF